nr:defensin-like protein 1 [Ipomoea batatas]
MALTKLNKVAFVALLVCFILIASYETQMVEAKKCMKHMSWGGRCPPMRCTNWCKGMGGYKWSVFLGGFDCEADVKLKWLKQAEAEAVAITNVLRETLGMEIAIRGVVGDGAETTTMATGGTVKIRHVTATIAAVIRKYLYDALFCRYVQK